MRILSSGRVATGASRLGRQRRVALAQRFCTRAGRGAVAEVTLARRHRLRYGRG